MIYGVYAEFSNVLGAFFDGCLSNVCPIMALVKRSIVNAHFLKHFTNMPTIPFTAYFLEK